MDEKMMRAAGWARNLEMRKAFRDVFAFPFYAAGWVVGRIVWTGRLMWGLVVVGYEDGAKR